MLRALLRRIPRFGFVTLFALMLLFVSAAGWLKFHLDLWREEEALLADLSNAGVEYSLVRHSGLIVEKRSRPNPTPAAPSFWDQVVPYFSRIDRIILRSPTSRALHERAARLPYARLVYGEWQPPRTVSAHVIAAKAGFEVPDLEDPAIPSPFEALPRGDAIDADETGRSRKKFLDAWKSPRTTPEQGIAAMVTSVSPMREFSAWNEGRQFDALDAGAFCIATPESSRSFGCYATDFFREDVRLDDPELAKANFERSKGRLVRSFPREALQLNLERLEIDDRFLAALREGDGAGVERIDETRVRFDLAPIVLEYPSADCEDAYSISIVARSDLDWEVEAWDLIGARTAGPKTPKTLPPIVSASYRAKLRRERDWVVTEEWVADYVYGPFPPTVTGSPPNLSTLRHAGVAKYDFSPGLNLSHVTPELFDAQLLPPRRELPWLPWHRATFALSLGLFAFVGVRRFAKKFDKASGGRQSPGAESSAGLGTSGD